MAVEKITPERFSELSADPDKTLLVKFYADWCGPCRQFAPVFAKFAADHPDLTAAEMNVEDEGVSSLAADLGVDTVPTVMLFQDGELRNRISGFLNRGDLDGIGL